MHEARIISIRKNIEMGSHLYLGIVEDNPICMTSPIKKEPNAITPSNIIKHI